MVRMAMAALALSGVCQRYRSMGLDHGVGHFRPLSLTRHRHLLTYHGTAMSNEGLCQVFLQFLSLQAVAFEALIDAFYFNGLQE